MTLTYRDVFFAYEGIGPHECYFCREFIDNDTAKVNDRLEIHHLDRDHSNCDISNLVAVHGVCHKSYHRQIQRINGRKGHIAGQITQKERGLGFHDPAVRQLGQEALNRNGTRFRVADVPKTAETRAKIGEKLRGRVFSAETRAKMSASARRRWNST